MGSGGASASAVAAVINLKMCYGELDDIVFVNEDDGATVDALMAEAIFQSERRSRSVDQFTSTKKYERMAHEERRAANVKEPGPAAVGPVKAPAHISKKWAKLLRVELDALPASVELARFKDLSKSGDRHTFVILHVNSGTSGTTYALRNLVEALGKFCVDELVIYIFVVDAQPVLARGAVAGVRPDLRAAFNGSGNVRVEVIHLTDYKAALESRDVRGVLTNFFRLLKCLGLERRLDLLIVDGCCERWKHNHDTGSFYTTAVELSIQIMVTVYLMFLRLNGCMPLAFHQEQVEYACSQISEVAKWPKVRRLRCGVPDFPSLPVRLSDFSARPCDFPSACSSHRPKFLERMSAGCSFFRTCSNFRSRRRQFWR